MSGERLMQWTRSQTPPIVFWRAAAIAWLGLLTAAAMVVVMRRFAGALQNPLEPSALLLAGFVLATAAGAVRWGWFQASSAQSVTPFDWLVMVVASGAILSIGPTLCLPGTPVIGQFLLGTLLIAEESGSWAWFLNRSNRASIASPFESLPSPKKQETSLRSSTHTSETVEETIDDDFEMTDDVLQRLTRSRSADGVETLSGLLRASFTSGQRTASVHVAFCPPFAATPKLEVEQLDGPDARIKVAQILPYGARLDLKLAATTTAPASVVLEFSAQASPEDAAL